MKLFISYAHEDKLLIARPLANALRTAGYEVWYDEFSLRVGDSLLKEVDRALLECDYGIVILSDSFFAKAWPEHELAGLVTRERFDAGGRRLILPVWHEVTVDEVRTYSPTIADRVAVSTSQGLQRVVEEIGRAVGPPTQTVGFNDEPELIPLPDGRPAADPVKVPELAAVAIASYYNDHPEVLRQETADRQLMQLTKETYLWSPDINDLIDKSLGNNNILLWTYLFYSQRVISVEGPLEDIVCTQLITRLLLLDRISTTIPINLYINSPGGNVYSSLAVYDVIQHIAAPVHTYGLELVGGTAALLVASGAQGLRFCLKDSSIYLGPLKSQEPDGEQRDDPNEAVRKRKVQDEAQRLQRAIVNLLSTGTGIHSTAVLRDISAEKKLSADQAYQYGFVDRVLFTKSLLPPWRWGWQNH
jgi:ATP-dependent Clp endopeptidase proteolytic subunit ClpP